MQMGNDPLAALRSMLDRRVSVEEAITPYLGIDAFEADKDADAEETSDGLLRDRLRDLVLILALREAPPSLARLAAALLWRSAPVATDVDELIDALRNICSWRTGLTDADVARIVAAHAEYEQRFDDIVARTGSPTGPEIDRLLADLVEGSRGDHVMVQLGDSLLIVEMSARHFFVGLQMEDGPAVIMDMIPHVRGGGGGWGEDPVPEAPRPRILEDA